MRRFCARAIKNFEIYGLSDFLFRIEKNHFFTFRAVVARPHGLAEARLSFKIKVAVAAAVGQTLQRLLVHLAAISSLPALLAYAGALRAETVAGTSRMGAVHLLAILPLVPTHAIALSIRAMPVPVAIRHFAFVVSEGTLLPLPPGIALAFPVYVLAYRQ